MTVSVKKKKKNRLTVKKIQKKILYKVLISVVCLFLCPIITHEPLDRLPQILIAELWRKPGMFLG